VNPEISATDRPVDRLSRDHRLDAIADAIQPIVQRAVDATGGASSPVSDMLHGRWLGHALHPLVTDIPIGAWSLTAAFDVLAAFGNHDLEDSADTALAIGIVGSLAAAATGFAEWSDTAGEPRRLGAAHAVLNSSALACYVVSLALRRSGRRGAGAVTGFLGYALTGAAAYLGGELAFGLGLGVKHTAEAIIPKASFEPVCAADAVADGETRPAFAGEIALLLTRSGETVSAVSGICPHRGAPLREGSIVHSCVRCPWHGSEFDLSDGTVVAGPATFDLQRFDARIENEQITVRPAFLT
jgi:nitrite reductase/ring-hydroxylating ferredoxin subunit/uncharacterized membrane protein